jgi:16S rRNA processing protein RimM
VLLEVGRITKAHGLRGDVLVDYTSDRHERMTAGTALRTADGELVIATASRFQDRWRVRFVGVDDRNAAEALRGVVLLAEALPVGHDDELWVHQLIGAELVDIHGTSYGRVESVIPNPASDLLALEDGRLVPAAFVTDHAAGCVVVDVPPGLLDQSDDQGDDVVAERGASQQ